MQTNTGEIADGIHRISAFGPGVGPTGSTARRRCTTHATVQKERLTA
ncbi:hypothetical protein [Nocardia higoensis]|nr:hypothetical protein [Nocardia higoensis]